MIKMASKLIVGPGRMDLSGDIQSADRRQGDPDLAGLGKFHGSQRGPRQADC